MQSKVGFCLSWALVERSALRAAYAASEKAAWL
jgi:hypothetical protein